MKTKTFYLCGEKGCCPVVKVGKNEVRIGEEGNLCVLKKSEWDTLISKIKSGEIQ